MPTTSNVVCCSCGRFMKVKTNGIVIEERTEDDQPYKLWKADLYACPDCGEEIATGFGQGPVSEHWQPRYNELKQQALDEGVFHPAR